MDGILARRPFPSVPPLPAWQVYHRRRSRFFAADAVDTTKHFIILDLRAAVLFIFTSLLCNHHSAKPSASLSLSSSRSLPGPWIPIDLILTRVLTWPSRGEMNHLWFFSIGAPCLRTSSPPLPLRDCWHQNETALGLIVFRSGGQRRSSAAAMNVFAEARRLVLVLCFLPWITGISVAGRALFRGTICWWASRSF